ncbi:hypothetical protein THIOM_002191, partial [Candidatus Thiomargarita nelsonii]
TPPIPDTLSENFSNLPVSSNPLIEKLLEHEGDAVQILDLGKHFEKALKIQKIDNILQKELIDKIKLDRFIFH